MKKSTAFHKLSLTICLVGLQVVWTIEMGYGTPYLVSLGLARPVLSLVWLAGPLSGLIMQPLIGAWSDRCKSRFGRRRPFIVVGSVCVVVSLLAVAHSQTIARLLNEIFSFGAVPFGNDGDDQAPSPPLAPALAIAIAFIGFYGLDFGLNAVQASCRSLIVDCLPVEQQASGNSWASAAISMGNVIGYSMGSVEMTRWLPLFGDSQIKALSTAACLLLVGTVCVTCWAVKEQPHFSSTFRHLRCQEGHNKRKGYRILKRLTRTIMRLPRKIQMICFAQFFAWIGWFPFNFFCSEYIKDLSLAEHDGDVDAAVRAGNLALLLFSCVSIATAICVPPVLAAIRRRRSNNDNSSRSPLLPIVWATSHLLFAGIMVAFVFTRSAQQSIILVSVVGICWAIATWVPFTLIGEYVATQQLNNHDACDSLSDYERKGDNGKDIGGDEDEDEEILAFSDCDNVGINQPQASYGTLESQQRSSIGTGSSAPSSDRRRSAANCAAGGETGVLLGIHNFFVVLPQFFATGLSSVIFELTSGRPESEAISWMWCIGGFCSILASLIAYSIQ